MQKSIIGLIVSLILFLLVLHGCFYILGHKTAVPNFVEKTIKKLVCFVFRSLLQLTEAVLKGIYKGIKAVWEWQKSKNKP